ncbi:Rho family DH domain-containing guanine nucleotide exchange factor [Suillus paluster]|uniref:Rho family DH domain-containing guanine nucleotide exchange factor n=1 Tax=Suillus paluster TaxID=48578 RepID=UPI001B863155|nr:Rho family DH domain-containing guanine nucleotide exchange factor [Suillus paluster]KAG1724515.1 Dbl homology domain-containing protein [Suillus paluster]
MTTSPPKVTFPSIDSAYFPLAAPITHLPFRRISLPSVPSSSLVSAQHRQSVASFASFDSLPEEPVVRRPKRRSLNRKHSRTPAPADAAQEAKRAKVIREFWDTERSYVQGLDLVHDHFLIPIIATLDSPRPLLTRTELTTIFSNFIDIWNFHHAFFSALTALLHPSTPHLDTPHSPPNPNPAPISPLLLSHLPYLSLYTPFITTFPSSISFLARPPAPFALFLRAQERDPRCGKLKLADWLLSIVQRCPRYVLLLREMMSVERREKEGEGEWDKLGKVLALVEKGGFAHLSLSPPLNQITTSDILSQCVSSRTRAYTRPPGVATRHPRPPAYLTLLSSQAAPWSSAPLS